MIIAICGTHNAGKTTLAHNLYSKLLKDGQNVGLLSEIADKSSKEDRTNLYTQYYIMNEQARAEDSLIKQYPLVISDRSVYDNLAYITLALQHTKNMNRLNVYKKAWELFNSRKDLYDGIILVNNYYNIKGNDPKRNPEELWQRWILTQIQQYIAAFYSGQLKTIESINTPKLMDWIVGCDNDKTA